MLCNLILVNTFFFFLQIHKNGFISLSNKSSGSGSAKMTDLYSISEPALGIFVHDANTSQFGDMYFE